MKTFTVMPGGKHHIVNPDVVFSDDVIFGYCPQAANMNWGTVKEHNPKDDRKLCKTCKRLYDKAKLEEQSAILARYLFYAFTQNERWIARFQSMEGIYSYKDLDDGDKKVLQRIAKETIEGAV